MSNYWVDNGNDRERQLDRDWNEFVWKKRERYEKAQAESEEDEEEE